MAIIQTKDSNLYEVTRNSPYSERQCEYGLARTLHCNMCTVVIPLNFPQRILWPFTYTAVLDVLSLPEHTNRPLGTWYAN